MKARIKTMTTSGEGGEIRTMQTQDAHVGLPATVHVLINTQERGDHPIKISIDGEGKVSVDF
jgi:hypothetical protein